MSITKVADLAGVSSSTVSRVINNHPRVAPKTAQAVRQAMASLSYTPSDRRPGPKPFKRQRAEVVHVKFLALGGVRGTATPGFAELLGGVSDAADHHGIRLSFSHVPDASLLARHLQDEPVDGLLLHGRLSDPSVRARLGRLPTVWMMGNRTRPDWGDQVMPDGYATGELAARHLIGRGHQTLGFVNLEAGFWALRSYEHAFRATAEEAGVTAASFTYDRPRVETYWQPHAAEAVEQVVGRLLDAALRPTGVFVADDAQVAQVQPALQRRGATVGRDGIELISCNNELPYLAGLLPRPASIDIRLPLVGRRAVEQLRWRLRHPEVADRFRICIEPRIASSEE